MIETYTDSEGIERCDECEQPAHECWCVCGDCGDNATDCACGDAEVAA
jgi:hypothetical protein